MRERDGRQATKKNSTVVWEVNLSEQLQQQLLPFLRILRDCICVCDKSVNERGFEPRFFSNSTNCHSFLLKLLFVFVCCYFAHVLRYVIG